ncbi:MAG: elongation factor 4, partial [Acidobacteria bacterium]
MDHIRNFCIIAHIDHSKSTLADRLIQRCGGVEDREFRDQILDSMDLERERGITIKANTVTLPYTARDGKTYELNLIDTPGHVDFSHEVRRSLMSCEGALLVVDASQGVEAQTVANLYLAMEFGLTIVPVINKIDLPSAEVDRVMEEIDRDLGLDPFESVQVSAKMGTGIDELLEAIVTKLPPPKGDPEAPLKALLFDAQYDSYRGAVLLVRLFDGKLKVPTRVRLMHSDAEHKVEEVGNQRLKRVPVPELSAGEVGYVLAGMKSLAGLAIGDTLTEADRPAAEPDDYEDLTKALEKLKLNDAALIYEKDSSSALGFGFRCGFLGLLHLDVVQERLEREYDLSLILSAPSVRHRIVLNNDKEVWIDNPSFYPDPAQIKEAYEPYIKAAIMTPERYLGAVMELCRERRGVETTYHFLAAGRMEVTSQLPLAEVLFDFYDR